jgi:hypothetical protein
MVVKISPRGLIATTRAVATPPLDDVVDSCGWPLLLEATPRRMQRELALHNPECVLFWLDDQRAVARTAHLIAWSRHRGARPYRVAVAYRLEGDVESVLRAAGAHSFLPLAGQSGNFVAAALERLMNESLRMAGAAAVESVLATSADGQIAPFDFTAEPVRPP